MGVCLLSFHAGISWSTEGAGGSGRVLADLTAHLPTQGVEVRGAVAAPPAVERATNGQFTNFSGPDAGQIRRFLGARKVIASELRQQKADLFASHFALYTFPVLDQLRARPFVMHFHGPWAAESLAEGAGEAQAKLKRRIERAVYVRADRVIVLSEAFAAVATRDYGVDPGKVRIVPGAVDLQRFQPCPERAEARRRLGWPEDRVVLVAVRRLVARMGLSNLVAAIASVKESFPNVVLYIAGKGYLRSALQSQIEKLDLQQYVQLVGFVPDELLPSVYQAADLNIVPSLALEGFGLIAAEALASGTPSMVTPVGGLPEVVSPLSRGLVFRSTSAEDIAAGIRGALEGKTTLPTAAECRRYAEQRFSASLMARRTAEVYRELCA